MKNVIIKFSICLSLVVTGFAMPSNAQAQTPPVGESTQTDTAVAENLQSETAAADKPKLIVVTGTPGEPEYLTAFGAAALKWISLAEKNQIDFTLIGRGDDADPKDIERLADAIKQASTQASEIWLVFIGHGTFDGTKARFNLRGPDVTAEQIAGMLKPCSQRVVIINAASSSGPFINRLSGPRRIIVTATKSGDQYNATRFGDYIGDTIANKLNDLDKDGQVSLLEAFVAASASTQEFYDTEQRIATEQALIDDNGDKLGTPASWFSGVRAIKTPRNAASPDGLAANQVFLVRSAAESTLTQAQRDARDLLESQLETLRRKKSDFEENEYLRQIEPLMIELARIYESAK